MKELKKFQISIDVIEECLKECLDNCNSKKKEETKSSISSR